MNRRSSAIASALATALVVAACGGALAPESEDTTSSSSSSSSSGAPPVNTSPPSGFPVPRDAGVAAVDASRTRPTPGFVSCPTETNSCTTATSVPFVCCVRKDVDFQCEKDEGLCLDGDAIGCDDNTDCAKGVCCAEEMGSAPTGPRFRFVTRCLPTCITGKPRIEVCTSDAECPTGICKEWNCGGFNMHGVKTCAPLGPCD